MSATAQRRVLVTGGAGFIGSRLCAALAGTASLLVLDDLSAGTTPAPSVPLARADIRDAAAVDAAFAGFRPEIVVHLAALHHIPTCLAEPQRTLAINVLGTQAVLDAAARHGATRFVLASTGNVYAWRDGPLDETAPLGPRDIYGVSKETNERQVRLWAEGGQRSARIARIFNTIGPGDPHGHLIPDLLARLDATPPGGVLRLGNAGSRRDYVDVADVAAGLALLAEAPAAAPGDESVEIVNLCSGRDHSAAEIALALAALRGIPVTLDSDPALRRAGDRPSQLGDPGRMAARFGWRARRGLEESLAALARAKRAA